MLKYANGILLSVLLLFLSATAASSGVMFVQCESFTGSHNIGGDGISATGCGGAINGMAVVGCDISGEWIEITDDAPLTAQYSLSLRTNAPIFQNTTVKAMVVGTAESCNFDFQGLGSG